MSSTNSTRGARSHARAQAQSANMRVPAAPADVEPSRLFWAETIPAGLLDLRAETAAGGPRGAR